MQLDNACQWVDGRLAEFALRPAAPPEWMATLKGLGDLAHSADVLIRSSTTAVQPFGVRWLDFAATELGNGERIRELIARDPSYVPAAVTALPLVLARRIGPAFVATVARQVRVARLPALAWTMLVPTLELCEIEPNDNMYALARRTSVLAQRGDPDRIPSDAAYVLAHECMYATRFAREAPRWDRETTAYVSDALPRLGRRARAAGDADLWSEIAIAYRAVFGGQLAGDEILSAHQTPVGNVEPPNVLDSIFPRLPHPRLGRTYHTTLVAIMAST